MAVNKVVYGTETLIDLTDDTATEVDVASGKKFHLANGVQATGTASVGGTQNTWYGTCPTGATAQTKVVTTISGDFSLTTGSMVRVKFTNAQSYNGGIKLDVDGTGAHNVMRQGTTVTVRYFYLAGEVVDFVYDGTNYIAVNEGIATTTYYGVTKLSSATNSTSDAMAATPAAVKAAYDHASSKQDALVSGENIKTINGESLLGSGDITVGGSGGGSSFLISMTYNGSSISNVSYNGATATEIAEAVVTDPTTRVVFALNVGSCHDVMYCTPSTIQASYNADWGDLATSIYAVAPMWYSDSAGDEKHYLLMLTYTSEEWYANKRNTI